MDSKSMHQVMSNLFIGDFQSSQDSKLLQDHKILHVVAAMRQEYNTLPGITLHRIMIDDTDTTNIIEHFVPVAKIIAAARLRSEAVLVHCQAGVSRSSALVAAYLMKEMDLTVEQAVAKIRKVRVQIEPSEFFMLQLELFERCNCEWNPVKYPEERRFLMSFAQSQIMDGTSPSLVLAYYPSPSPSPRDTSPTASFTMTPLTPSKSNSASLNSHPENQPSTPSISQAPDAPAVLKPFPLEPTPAARKRLTPRKPAREAELQSAALSKSKRTTSVEKIGTKEEVVVQGRRIRCKMCRRELAAREHILVHEPGQGQQAFAPHRRDMAAHRAEVEARRRDEIDRERLKRALEERKATSGVSEGSRRAEGAGLGPPSLAGLRISRPTPTSGIPGLRIAVPRPAPKAAPGTSAIRVSPRLELDQKPTDVEESSNLSDAGESVDEKNELVELATTTPDSVVDPPLLPSHLCSSYFTEPLSWMLPTLKAGELGGKIMCPNVKCGAKLGSFDWAGAQCSCGAWICPGFALNVSRVDEISDR